MRQRVDVGVQGWISVAVYDICVCILFQYIQLYWEYIRYVKAIFVAFTWHSSSGLSQLTETGRVSATPSYLAAMIAYSFVTSYSKY